MSWLETPGLQQHLLLTCNNNWMEEVTLCCYQHRPVTSYWGQSFNSIDLFKHKAQQQMELLQQLYVYILYDDSSMDWLSLVLTVSTGIFFYQIFFFLLFEFTTVSQVCWQLIFVAENWPPFPVLCREAAAGLYFLLVFSVGLEGWTASWSWLLILPIIKRKFYLPQGSILLLPRIAWRQLPLFHCFSSIPIPSDHD